jgi:dTDP-4-dehydrorhamnose reductase
MKTAVLGAHGQLGRDLCPRLPGQVVQLTRDRIDLGRPETIADVLDAIKPDVVVNCAAYNFVDQAEREPEAAFAVNAWGVRHLAHACATLGCTLVHFSTDYVFGLDADRRTPWEVSDAPGPVSVYGLSKLAGEYLVRSLCERHFVIRTCGLYGVWGSGGKGKNFVETMLRMAGEGKVLRVVDDQRCTPSYTADVADATVRLIETGRFGLYHVTNGGDCTWYELAGEIFRQAGVTALLSPTTTAGYPLPARRPAYSVLSSAAYRGLGLPAPRPWQEALGEYLRERQSRRG